MAADADNVQYLLGDLYDALGTNKDTIITAMIARAKNYVDEYTGSKTGGIVDNTIESVAAMYILQRMVTGSNSTNAINIGAIRIGAKDVRAQIEELRRQIEEQLGVVGRSSTARFKLTQPLLGF